MPALRSEPRVYAEWPALRAAARWRPLAHVPTPVESCDAIADYLGRTGVWMKRDDLISPLYGGNKIRRYEFLLADAAAQGCTRLVTLGGIASTQVTATAVLAEHVGLGLRAVLYDQPVTTFARDALLTDVSFGADLVRSPNIVFAAVRLAWEYRGRKTDYLVPPGASTPLPNLGYLDAMLELAEQVEAGACPRPDAMIVPTGSAGTLAALALGCRYLGWDTTTIGVAIAPRIAVNRLTVGAVVSATARYLRKHAGVAASRLDHARFELDHGQLGPGYGEPTPDAIEGTRQWQRLTGAVGEVTYAGKALSGLRALARSERWKGKHLLMWNTLSTVRPPIAADARARLPRDFERFFSGAVPV